MHLSRAEVNSLGRRDGNACGRTGTCSQVSGRWSGKYELIVVVNEDIMKNHVY